MNDAIIALACVIRGGTPHFDYVASEVSKGLANASMEVGIPVSFGVLTTNSIEQAIERAGTEALVAENGNVLRISGSDSKISCTVCYLALEMLNVLQIGDTGS